MMLLLHEHINSDELSHGYALEGDRAALLAALSPIIEEALGAPAAGNPDATVLERDRLLVEDSRTIIDQALQRPVAGGERCFVVAFSAATGEAQNALLKLLEEPREGDHFFLVVPSVEVLLPTLRSRLYCVDARGLEGARKSDTTAPEFLAATPAERLEKVAPFITEKDREGARVFLESLERELYRSGVTSSAEALHTVSFARSYIGDQSSSVKMLLEYVAAALPQRSSTA